jgi:hypothetical protein
LISSTLWSEAVPPLAPAPGPKQGRGLVLMVAVILVVASVAAVALVLMSPGEEESRDYQEDDYLSYKVTGWYGGSVVDGWANMTFNTVTSSLVSMSFQYTGIPTSEDFSDTFPYTFVDGVWKSPALTGEALESAANKVGDQQVQTAYGTVETDVYQLSLSSGVYHYYVAEGTGTPVKLEVTAAGLHYEMVLRSTNVAWVQDL